MASGWREGWARAVLSSSVANSRLKRLCDRMPARRWRRWMDGEPLASLSVARSVGRAAMGQLARGRAEYAAVDVTRRKTR